MSTLYSKEGFTFYKLEKNSYKLCFQMENKNIILSKVIDFSLLKLIYDLNPDIYEKVNLHKINDNEAVINMLMKHLFEDLGLPQRFSHLYMKKIEEQNKIIFMSQSIKSERPEGMPLDAELMPVKDMTCFCDILTSHKIFFTCMVNFEDNMNVPEFAERIIGLILFKIFNRVKTFIENVK